MFFLELKYLNIVIPLIIYIYVILSIVRRLKKIDKNYKILLALGGIFSILWICLILFHIYQFNGFSGFNIGSDSVLYEKVLLSIKETNSFENAYKYEWLKNDGKIFGVYLNSFVYKMNTTPIQNQIIIFILNLILHIFNIITGLRIYKEKVENSHENRNNRFVKGILLIFYFGGIALIPTFLRDILNLSLIVEFIYLFFVKKVKWYHPLLLFCLFALANIRPLYSIVIIVYLVLYEFLKINNLKYQVKRNRFFTGIFIIIIFGLIFFLLDGNLIIKDALKRTLVLMPKDEHHLGVFQSLNIEYDNFDNVSTIRIIGLAIIRFIVGAIRFVLAPVFTLYLNFITKKSFYYGFDIHLIHLIQAFLYNFILFPLIINFVIEYFKSKTLNDLERFILFILLGIILTYSIKFLGMRNPKVDYIYQYLLMIFLFGKCIEKSNFLIGFGFMVFVNILGLIKTFIL